MDTSSHTLTCLFAQLGLENSTASIESFINTHKGLPANLTLAEANFWSSSQSNFINEAITDDSDWAEIVDTLDVLLR